MNDVVIIGGGPAGLAAAHEAVGCGAKAIVLEKLDRVGGLARTTEFEDCRFDVGPHRFFTKNQEVHALFVKMAAEDLLSVPRLTRIFYNNTYFNYPLTPLNALFGVGVLSSISILSSYMSARARGAYGERRIENFEDWIVDHFGRRLFETFFKTYTERRGIPCTQIGADWASQRIKGLSLTTALVNALFKPKKNIVKTLVDEFIYPRLGAGQLYEKMAAQHCANWGPGHDECSNVPHPTEPNARLRDRGGRSDFRALRGRGTLFSRERSSHRHDQNDVSERAAGSPVRLLRVTLSQSRWS